MAAFETDASVPPQRATNGLLPIVHADDHNQIAAAVRDLVEWAPTVTGGEADGAAVGDFKYWDGTTWVMLSVGADGEMVQAASGVPSWAPGLPTSPTLGEGIYFDGTNWVRLGAPPAAGRVLSSVADGAGFVPSWGALGSGGLSTADLLLWGNGADGDVTISTNTTLTRDMFYNNLTINSGAVLNTGGYRVFVANTWAMFGSVTVARNGANGSGATAGAALAAGTLSGSSAGGAGTTGNGFPGVAANASYGASGGAGGRSLQNDNVTTYNPGGAAGAATAPTAVQGSLQGIADLIAARFGVVPGALTTKFTGGAGGGGGGGNGSASSFGGGGGSGGGVVMVCARLITHDGVGVASIQANGGNGGNGSGTLRAGGGGGGGGGTVIVITTSAQPGTVTTSVAGGTGGLLLYPGVNGSAGSTGNKIWAVI